MLASCFLSLDLTRIGLLICPMSLLQYDERLFLSLGTAHLRRQEEVALERAPSLFGYLFRQIGNPLWCDSPTVQRERLAYVRVCVEVMPNSELPKEVLLMNNEGIKTRIPV